MDTPDRATFGAALTPGDLPVPDGVCPPANQAQIDLLKHGQAIAARHGVPPAYGLFAARAVRAAARDGRLTCRPVAMKRCQVTGRMPAMPRPRRATRDNPDRLPVEMPFWGLELQDGNVSVLNHPSLGVSSEGLELIRPILAEELRAVAAEIPEQLTGEPPRYRWLPVVRHEACGWEGREGMTKGMDPRWSGPTCPCCGARDSHYDVRAYRTTGRHEVISVGRATGERRDTRVARDRRFDPSPFTLVSRSNPEACSVLARRGQAEDYLAVRRIANEAGNRVAFGFLARVIFEGAAAAPGRNPFWVAVVHGEVAAWLRGYHRLDGLTTLHEIGVGVREQSHGIGTALLRLLVDDAMAMGSLAIRVSTPAELRSNAWYPKFGFVLTGQRPSPRRILNDYRLELAAPPG